MIARQLARQAGLDVGDRLRRVLEDCGQHRQARVALERPLAGGHLVEHARPARTRRSAIVDRPALGLFGRHVRRPCPRMRPWPVISCVGRTVAAVAGRCPPRSFARPKSRTLTRSSGADHHVGRLEVAVHDAVLVGGRDRAGDLRGDHPGRDRVRSAPLTITSDSGRPSTSSIAMNWCSPTCSTAKIVTMPGWLREASVRASRSNRRRRSASVRDRVGQQLECHLAPKLRVTGTIHLAHPTGADEGHDLRTAPSRAPGDSSTSALAGAMLLHVLEGAPFDSLSAGASAPPPP